MRSLRLLSAVPALALFAGIALAGEPTPVAPADPVAPVAAVEPVTPADAVEPVAAGDFVDPVDACELNYTPADPEAAAAAVSAKPCRTCRDQSFCKCSYNGLPRVSCDPCCYGNLGIPQICSS
jgi:hypothetical protein